MFFRLNIAEFMRLSWASQPIRSLRAIGLMAGLMLVSAMANSANADFIVSPSESLASQNVGTMMATENNRSGDSGEPHATREFPTRDLTLLFPWGWAGADSGGCGTTPTHSGGSSGSSSAGLLGPIPPLTRQLCLGRLSVPGLLRPPRPDPLKMLDPPRLRADV
jgi:hypothetical protein